MSTPAPLRPLQPLRRSLSLPRLRAMPVGSPRALPGSGFLSIGLALFGAILTLVSLAGLLTRLPTHPAPVFAVTAWGVLLVAVAVPLISVLRSGEMLPGGVYWTGVALWSAAVLVDVFPLVQHGTAALSHASAAIGAGSVLLAVVGLRRTPDLLVPNLHYAVLLIWVALYSANGDTDLVRVQLLPLALALIPPSAAIIIARDYRRYVYVQLDRTMVQSTVIGAALSDAPSFGGELARLDDDAEQLLNAVADGTLPYPLPKQHAEAAAELATELRLHLIEGRRQTWLYHAIRQSALLEEVVSLEDPDSLAALLTTEQRDGLLTALWQLAATRAYAAKSLAVTIGPAGQSPVYPNGAQIPMRLVLPGVRLRRISPAIRQSVERVGEASLVALHDGSEVRILCQVAQTARQ